jgi:pimeloyl-ACP methyl ester carboxylesterase
MWLKASCGTSLMNRILIALAALGVAGCIAIGDSTRPIAVETFVAPRPPAARTLVIVLPGFGVDAQDMRERGLARAIQEGWPEADVLLASATFAYYRDGKLVSRLHEDVVAPAVRAGYRRIWLSGASMGGMGALLYEREHGALLAGVVLFAPFLGDEALLEEIRKAGGVRKWEPGPLTDTVDARNYQRHVWKMVREWTERPELASRVWLASGSEDYLMSGVRLLATALPQDRFIETSGGHTWSTWIELGKAVFSRIRTVEPDAL